MTLWLSSDTLDITYSGKQYRANPVLNGSTTVAYLFNMSLGVWALWVVPGHQWGNGSYEGIVLMRSKQEWRSYIAQSPTNPDRVTVDIKPQHIAQLM